jgi:hypothetical protein
LAEVNDFIQRHGVDQTAPEWLQQVEAETSETSFENVIITIQAATPARRTTNSALLLRRLPMQSSRRIRTASTAARATAPLNFGPKILRQSFLRRLRNRVGTVSWYRRISGGKDEATGIPSLVGSRGSS